MSKQADEQQDPIVFIVDDDISVCRSLSRLLTFVNYRVEVFTSAEVFLQRLPYHGEGLILLDVSMLPTSIAELERNLTILEPVMRHMIVAK